MIWRRDLTNGAVETVKVTALTNLTLVSDLLDKRNRNCRLNPSLCASGARWMNFGCRLHGATVRASLQTVLRKASPLAGHRATDGDSLASIAKRYGTTTQCVGGNRSVEEVTWRCSDRACVEKPVRPVVAARTQYDDPLQPPVLR